MESLGELLQAMRRSPYMKQAEEMKRELLADPLVESCVNAIRRSMMHCSTPI